MDATTAFFEELAHRGHEPSLRHATGNVRFEVIDDAGTATWLVAIDHGNLAVSRDHETAACVVRAPRPVFDQMTTGELNAMAAVLRGAVAVEGDPEVLVRFQRLLPAPRREASDRGRP